MKFCKHIFAALALAFLSSAASAQLSTAQIATLRTAILADAVLAPKCISQGDAPYEVAFAFNMSASPVFTVWRTNVPDANVGIAFNSTELAGLTTANTNRLMVMQAYSGGTFNPSQTDVRAGFDTVFGGAGGALTRANLLILWKRTATRAEKLFAAGTGSDASPAVMSFEGTLSFSQVLLACP